MMAVIVRRDDEMPHVFGMIHTAALPGSPGWKGSMPMVIDAARADLESYRRGGVDGVIVENMHDRPYLLGRVEPETTAAMSAVCLALRMEAPDMPMGVQVLAGANREALGVALAAGLDIIRVEGFAYAHVADEGILEACAGPLLRTRAALDARHVQIIADVKKKHASHALTGDLSLEAVARGTAFCLPDALILTGEETGVAPEISSVAAVRCGVDVPLLIGSGVDEANVAYFLEADGLIVGSAFKYEGDWRRPVDAGRVGSFMRALKQAWERRASKGG